MKKSFSLTALLFGLFAPRSILKNVLARYAALGLKPVVAPETGFI